jgi:4-hydroxybenzoate polyprenyltransferase
MANRWWIYQRERFPVAAHGPLIAAFSFSAISYSALVRHADGVPRVRPLVVAFVSAFLFFLQLRIADEFKDFEEDSRFRPYRPVPRGLITLRDLAKLWVLCISIQLALALWLSPRLLVPLVVTWIYLALMSKEFFLRKWLKRNPVVYMVSHMMIMPLVDLYTTACDWVPAGYRRPPDGLLWFLVVSFFNGMVLEIGRKIRTPNDEENGVETYSYLWGRNVACVIWVVIMGTTAAAATMAARGIDFTAPALAIYAAMLLIAIGASVIFLRLPLAGRGRWIEGVSGVWSLALYLSLGTVPILLRMPGAKR